MASLKPCINLYSPPGKSDCSVGCLESEYLKLDNILGYLIYRRSFLLCNSVVALHINRSNYTFYLKSNQHRHSNSSILVCNTFDALTPRILSYTNRASCFKISKFDEPCSHTYLRFLYGLDGG